MLEPAEIEGLPLVDADCLHGCQPIENVTDASRGCDTPYAAQSRLFWELLGWSRRHLTESQTTAVKTFLDSYERW